MYGVYISRDGGATWAIKNNGLEDAYRYIQNDSDVNRLFNIGFSPNYASDGTLFASSSWKSSLKAQNRGERWQEKFLTSEAFQPPLLISPSPNYAEDETVYVCSRPNGYILKSTDGGVSFSLVGNVRLPVTLLRTSPDFTSDKTLYAGALDKVYESNDGGETWMSSSNLAGDVTSLAISSSKQDKVIFAGTKKGLFIRRNGGDVWSEFSGNADFTDDYIEAIFISPNYQQDQTVMTSVRGLGLFKSTDGGSTFVKVGDLISQNHQLSNFSSYFHAASEPILFSPSFAVDKTIYGYSEKEVLKSVNGGDTWQVITLPDPKSKSTLSYLYFYSLFFLERKLSVVLLFLGSVLFYLVFVYPGLERKVKFKKRHVRAGYALIVLSSTMFMLVL